MKLDREELQIQVAHAHCHITFTSLVMKVTIMAAIMETSAALFLLWGIQKDLFMDSFHAYFVFVDCI